MSKKIDWKKIEEWNSKYLMKCFATKDEYHWTPVERTEGDYLIMPDGTRLLDFFNQLYCVNVGQKNPKVVEYVKDALDRYGFVWDIYTTDYKATVAKLLLEDILGNAGWAAKIRYTNSGGESVEVACIIARLFTGKPLIATREHAYHGVTAGAVSLNRVFAGRSHLSGGGNNTTVRQVPGQNSGNAFVCPMPFCYRCSIGHTYPECKSCGSQLPCVLATERMILNHGVDQVAAIITEPAMGAGTIMPPDEYLSQIYEMTRRLGILWIVDEVLMGFGRLGKWFGHQKYGKDLKPDIMTVAKGITSSQIPCGAVIVNKEIAEFMDSMRWNHVSTFAGHPIALAAAQGNLEYMIENNIPKMAKKAGEYFGAKLKELEEKHKTVGLVAGAGMFWQVELVKNKETKEPFVPADRYTGFAGDTSKNPTGIILGKCLEKGVLLGGFVPNTLRVGASLTVSQADMDKAIDALEYALSYLDTMI
ncbi:MAG: aspartate aminotransferase family protein [Dehalobacterium sp.]